MNYEQKYKEAFEIAKEVYHDHRKDRYWRDWLTKLFPELKESEDERIRKEIVDFIASANKYGTNDRCEAWLSWLEKQGKNKESDDEWEVTTGLYKCTKRMFDGTPESGLLFETGNLYRCISKNDIAEFESSYGHNVFLIDPVVRQHFIKVKD